MRCPACSAPLPASSSAGTTTCSHCGIPIQLGGHSVRTGSKSGGSAAGIVVTIVLIGGALFVVFGGVMAYFMLAAVDEVEEASREVANAEWVAPKSVTPVGDALDEASAAPAPPPKPDGGLSLSALPELSDGSWHKIDAPGMVGSHAEFEAVENLVWAETIAQAWSQDAVFVRLDAGGVRPTGQVDLSTENSDWRVRYTFISPARREIARKMAEVSEDPVYSELRIDLDQGEAQVMVDTERLRFVDEPPPPLPAVRCTLEKALAQLQTPDGGLPKRPRYDVTLRWRTPYTGLRDWLIEADGSHKGVFVDTCELWTIEAARARHAAEK